ncbi:type II secretion system protein GspH [Patescibacteria group bacterium]|nr:MAG: type II secretion system protein GspH [Patescibacteria group bacterium]
MIKQHKKGFTLLEMLIVIAIFGIMSAAIMVSLGRSRQQRQVEAAGRDVMAALKVAQNGALTGAKLIGSEPYPCEYSLQTSGSDYSVAYKANVNPGDSCAGATTKQLFSKTLPNNVTFDADYSATFQVPGGEPGGYMEIHLTNGSAHYRVKVNAAGNITGDNL